MLFIDPTEEFVRFPLVYYYPRVTQPSLASHDLSLLSFCYRKITGGTHTNQNLFDTRGIGVEVVGTS
jgi:hypothetical protein